MIFLPLMTTEIPPWAPQPGRYMYEQLAAHLAARIETGQLAAGDRLPAEKDLAAEYGVAYHTVRSAVGLLRERGLVVTLHGLGTFVAGKDEGPATP